MTLDQAYDKYMANPPVISPPSKGGNELYMFTGIVNDVCAPNPVAAKFIRKILFRLNGGKDIQWMHSWNWMHLLASPTMYISYDTAEWAKCSVVSYNLFPILAKEAVMMRNRNVFGKYFDYKAYDHMRKAFSLQPDVIWDDFDVETRGKALRLCARRMCAHSYRTIKESGL